MDPLDRARLVRGKKRAKAAAQACRRAAGALAEVERIAGGDVFGTYVLRVGDEHSEQGLAEFLDLARSQGEAQIEIVVMAP